MRIEKLVEILQEYLDIDAYDIFAGVEEMRMLGFNTMSLTIDWGPGVELSFLYLRYLVSVGELEPIAIVIQLKKDKVRDLYLDQVLKLIHSLGGYLYGGSEAIGFLIPVNDENLRQILLHELPRVIEELLGYTVKPRIKGFEIGFQQEE